MIYTPVSSLLPATIAACLWPRIVRAHLRVTRTRVCVFTAATKTDTTSLYLSIHLSIYPSIYLSLYLFLCLCVCQYRDRVLLREVITHVRQRVHESR